MYVVLHKRFSNYKNIVTCFIAILSLVTLASCNGNMTSKSSLTKGVYLEFGSFTASSLPLLEQTNTSLLLAVYPSGSTYSDRIGSAELLNTLKEASNAGVSVRLWPMLSQVDGVWPDEDNVDAFALEINSLMTWLNANGVKPGWLVFDLEPPYSLTVSMTTAAKTGNSFSAISLLLSYMSPATFQYALARFTDIVKTVHNNGWKAECVTYPLVLDDRYDTNSAMQVLFHIPVIGIPWNQVSFMVYQSSFKELFGQSFGSAIVASYAQDAYKLYGNKAIIALGVIGTDPISGAQGYTTTAALDNDIAAALGEDIGHIEIYSLEEILMQPSPSTWLDTSAIKPEKVHVTADVESMRQLMQSFARNLNANL